VTTTLSLGVEVGVGGLDRGDVVEIGTEVGVLLGEEEDKDHVDQRKTGEGPTETHDTSRDTGAFRNSRVGGAVVRVLLLVENGSGNDGSDLEEEKESSSGDNVGSLADNTSTRGSDDPESVEHLEDGSDQHGDNGRRVVVGASSLLLDTDDINDHLKESVVDL
jgi:hypothetical protein